MAGDFASLRGQDGCQHKSTKKPRGVSLRGSFYWPEGTSLIELSIIVTFVPRQMESPLMTLRYASRAACPPPEVMSFVMQGGAQFIFRR